MATSHRAILAALLLAACDIPSGDPGCLSGRDVSNWMVTEHDPAAVTTPIVSCGKTVGYAIELPDGMRSNVLWALEAQFPVVAGSKVKLGADIAANPDATMFRASMDEIGPVAAVRTEFAFAEAKPARVGRVDINDTVSAQNSVMRVIRIVTPLSGAWSGRVTGFDW